MRVYLNFGVLRSFVFAFFSLAWLKSVIEPNNWPRSPLAAAGGGAEGGGGGAGGGGRAAVGGGGGAAWGVLGVSTLVAGAKGVFGDVRPVDNCNGSILTERCEISTMKNEIRILLEGKFYFSCLVESD